jgi:hypothetical protein
LNRTVDGAVDEMCRLLKWAGIDWDEGIIHGFLFDEQRSWDWWLTGPVLSGFQSFIIERSTMG